MSLRQMTEGGNVVEDYGHTGLTLRAHSVSFLRDDLTRRQIVTCAEAASARDERWLMAAGLVLVRQKPGSAKGVMFMTIEPISNFQAPRAPSHFMGTKSAAPGGSSRRVPPISPMPSAPARR